MAGWDAFLTLATPSIEFIFPLDLYRGGGNVNEDFSWIEQEIQIHLYLFIHMVRGDGLLPAKQNVGKVTFT